MSFHRKRKRWSGPGLDPAKSLEVWKSKHPYADTPAEPPPQALASPVVPSDASRSGRRPWFGLSTASPTAAPPPPAFRETQAAESTTPQSDPQAETGNLDSPLRLQLSDNPFLNGTSDAAGMPAASPVPDGIVTESTEVPFEIEAAPRNATARPRSLVLRLIRFAARFVRRITTRSGRPPTLTEPLPSKGMGEQVDEFVDLLTSGNSLPPEHRDKLLQALRGGLESATEDLRTETPSPEEPKREEYPVEPAPAAVAVTLPPPPPPDPATELERQKELQAKDRQIEILEVKVRRLASMLRERERRNAEAQEQAARSRPLFPGVSGRRRKTPAQPKEGTSDLMLGIRELNRQIREEIQSLYSGRAVDPGAATVRDDDEKSRKD